MTARRTIVSLHAHPDDEALLTGGFLAGAAASGHRVVLIVATDGGAGLSDGADADLGRVRRAELLASAQALGVARVEWLGYADSGFAAIPHQAMGNHGDALPRFADADPEDAAARIARVLQEENATLLTTYDAAGGYGHPDHRQVHLVGARAAQLAGTPVVLEATVDRTTIARALVLLRLLALVVPMPRLPSDDQIFSARADITHRLDVRAHLPAKRAALRAHGSQATGGPRTIALLLALPRMLSDRVLGVEWFRVAAGGPVDLGDYLVNGRASARVR